MTQLVTRIDDELAAGLDELVARGVASSRSDAVRQALRALIDEQRRAAAASAIVTSYRDSPQTQAEVGWSDDATRRMISDEPW